ncbi:MAG: hypothetical protein K2Y27_35090 [Xanthobacteraceae bacterium]|nr:hypothetical protein [Xanthobacteraceae bacterium]
MAKKASTPKKRPVGRPPKDPDDLRTVRFSFRMHPDLYEEITRGARIAGLPISTFAERTLIARINRTAGVVLLDAIGRKTTGTPPKLGSLAELALFSPGQIDPPYEDGPPLPDDPQRPGHKRDRSPR